ncbi:hypothetical protein ACTOXX_14300 [Streptomyces rubiginosohelvolus]|uniref:hypothetical protein n=1 Tax=Streptomyces rubiginosohelvolus TaxID=67362 RepID=UPI0034364E70
MPTPPRLRASDTVDVAAVLGPGWTAVDLTMIAGLAALPLLLWRRAPLPVALVAAVAVTAALRMWV